MLWSVPAIMLLFSLLLLLPVSLARAEGGPGWPQLALEEVVGSGLNSPLQVTHAGDGSGRLFIVEKGGRILIYKQGTLLPVPFLDLRGQVSTDNERGLLGLAFSPDYASDGDFYVDYTDLAGNTQIVRYHVSSDPDLADPASGQIVLTVNQDFANHNGGQIAFGPDNLFYIGFGDGGGAGDPNGRSQDPAQLLGKMLRIDVESGDPLTYTIPSSNPYTQIVGYRPEIWTLGMRNPWRFSFDRATGDLWIADVGQSSREEINLQPAASPGGENYGWRCYEGTLPYNLTGCGPADDFTFPIFEYGHGSHPDFPCYSVTGGFVYRGASFPAMEGLYLYADHCSGYIWGLRNGGTPQQENQLLRNSGFWITSFGEDEAGELYLTAMNPGNHKVYRLVDSSAPTAVGTVALRSERGSAPPAALLVVGLALLGASLIRRRSR